MEKNNYSISVNLNKFDGAFISTVRNTNGQEEKCICIPLRTQLVEGQFGNVYANLVMIETNNSMYGNTHLIKRGATKVELENKPANEFVKTPIIGNAKPLVVGTKKENPNAFVGNQPQQAPQQQSSVQPEDMPF